MKKLTYRIFLYLNAVAVLLLFLCYLSVYVNPAHMWILSFFGLIYPVVLFINAFFILFWAIYRKKEFLLSLIVVLCGWNFIINSTHINLSNNKHNLEFSNFEKSQTIKLLSYNVRLFNLYKWVDISSTHSRIYDLIEDEKPDIICFQEYYTEESGSFASNELLAELQNKYYSHIFYTSSTEGYSNFGIVTFSSFPIINKGNIRFENTINSCIYSDILINNDTLRIYNNHLQSIYLNHENYKFIDKPGIRNDNETISNITDITKRLKHAYIKRAEQADTISDHIKSSPFPVIVCGDFNDTPMSYSYKKLSKDLTDAFINSGSGSGYTYVRKFPSIRIDYILHSKAIDSYNFKIPKVILSDHYPVICNLFIGQAE